ncbi:MAG TPA: NAD-dependent epimerase/dehydratase family protein [Kribbella sp.]|uniref:NAD-dependent epimerase/dehydratase family protein n=1 Tax=Kribbella sp. TaxID=1871183 RepID=UPI002D78C68F|nr:NAD-dependent epimerase/dehydratase family protein [Kribbella sp.]HET6295999.1 NAD-dependent epimerase/dehydratase family protein [Kribbella sp.]
MAETVLVTGGTGYVAGWCVVELLKRGFDVRTTVRSLAKEAAVRTAVASEVDPGERLSFHVADLTSDAGWDTALAGVDYVLHVASPLGDGNPKNPDDLIIPAREGAVRVLRAATEAGVKRVVLTSACAAASPSLYTEDSVTDETLWTDPDDPRLTTYRKSKTLAERAAWDFMASYDGPTTLTTILPGAVFGPVLAPADGGSVQVIGRLLDGRMPGTPRLGFEIVDVRDLADVHIRAMTADAAAGQRFIAVGEFLWMSEMATALRTSLGESARKVPTRRLPDFALKAMSLFDSSLRDITPALGRKHRHTAAKAEHLLGWHARPATETVTTCGQSLLTKNAL